MSGGGLGAVGYPQVYLPSAEGGGTNGGYPLFPPGAPAEEEGGILTRLWRRKFTFLSVFVLVLGLVAGAYFVVPHTYRTTASVGISSANIVLGTAQAPAPLQTVGDPADLESQSVVLSSTPLLQVVLGRPGVRDALISECEMKRQPPFVEHLLAKVLDPPAACPDQVDDTATEIAALQDRYTITASGRSRVIDVSYPSPSPQIAQLMTNTLVQAYLDLRTGEKLKPRDAAISWLRGEIGRLSDKLKTSEQTIEAFLNSHNLVKGQTSSIASERLSSLSQQLALAQGRPGDRRRAPGADQPRRWWRRARRARQPQRERPQAAAGPGERAGGAAGLALWLGLSGAQRDGAAAHRAAERAGGGDGAGGVEREPRLPGGVQPGGGAEQAGGCAEDRGGLRRQRDDADRGAAARHRR